MAGWKIAIRVPRRRLLRARRERPGRGRAADERDERAPPHGLHPQAEDGILAQVGPTAPAAGTARRDGGRRDAPGSKSPTPPYTHTPCALPVAP